jgi:hypothetical protein
MNAPDWLTNIVLPLVFLALYLCKIYTLKRDNELSFMTAFFWFWLYFIVLFLFIIILGFQDAKEGFMEGFNNGAKDK